MRKIVAIVLVIGLVAFLFIYGMALEDAQTKVVRLSDLNYTVPEHPYNTTVSMDEDGNTVYEGKLIDVWCRQVDLDTILFEDGTIVPVSFAEHQPWRKGGVQNVTVDYSGFDPVVTKVAF